MFICFHQAIPTFSAFLLSPLPCIYFLHSPIAYVPHFFFFLYTDVRRKDGTSCHQFLVQITGLARPFPINTPNYMGEVWASVLYSLPPDLVKRIPSKIACSDSHDLGYHWRYKCFIRYLEQNNKMLFWIKLKSVSHDSIQFDVIFLKERKIRKHNCGYHK